MEIIHEAFHDGVTGRHNLNEIAQLKVGRGNGFPLGGRATKRCVIEIDE